MDEKLSKEEAANNYVNINSTINNLVIIKAMASTGKYDSGVKELIVNGSNLTRHFNDVMMQLNIKKIKELFYIIRKKYCK